MCGSEDNFLAHNDETQTASVEVEEVDFDDDDDTPMKVQTCTSKSSSHWKMFNSFCTARDTHLNPMQMDTSVDAHVSLHPPDNTDYFPKLLTLALIILCCTTCIIKHDRSRE